MNEDEYNEQIKRQEEYLSRATLKGLSRRISNQVANLAESWKRYGSVGHPSQLFRTFTDREDILNQNGYVNSWDV